MAKTKTIEELAWDEIKKGDLVQIQLDDGDEYTGYYMHNNLDKLTKEGTYLFQSTLKWNQNPSVLSVPSKNLSVAGEEPDLSRKRVATHYKVLEKAKRNTFTPKTL